MSCYKTVYSYTAQLLYITSIPIFGQHYAIEALGSEFEVSPAVWNVLTPEYKDQAKKALLSAKKCKDSITLSISVVLNLFQVNNQIIFLKVDESRNQINENFQLLLCTCCWFLFFKLLNRFICPKWLVSFRHWIKLKIKYHKLHIKSNLSLYLQHYAKACNEFAGPIFASLRRTTQLISRKYCSGDEPLATSGSRFEPKTSCSRNERVTARPTGRSNRTDQT